MQRVKSKNERCDTGGKTGTPHLQGKHKDHNRRRKMQHDIIEMINEGACFKKVVFERKGKRGQGNVDFVDCRRENIAQASRIQRSDKRIAEEMHIIVPVDELIL